MLCERCKIREANIQYTEVINGVKTEHNFCTQCAKELDFGQYSALFDGDFPLGKLLSGLLSGETASPKESRYQQIVCPTCKTTYEEFVKNSRFGCSDCYSVFGPLINESIKQIQGRDTHTGKCPKNFEKTNAEAVSIPDNDKTSVSEQIKALDRELKSALMREEYEEAAKYRDQIKILKKGEEEHE